VLLPFTVINSSFLQLRFSAQIHKQIAVSSVRLLLGFIEFRSVKSLETIRKMHSTLAIIIFL